MVARLRARVRPGGDVELEVVGRHVVLGPALLLVPRGVRGGLDLLLELARAPLEDVEELLRQPLEEVQRGRGVHVLEPLLVLRRHGDLVVGPLAREVDAHARDHGRRVAEAHGGQVQTAKTARSLAINPLASTASLRTCWWP